MSWLRNHFIGFGGRIGRKQYWIGNLVIVVAAFVAGVLLGVLRAVADPRALEQLTLSGQPPTLAESLLALALLYPAIALTAKRFNDRDRPGWVWIALAVFTLPMYVGPLFGTFWNYAALFEGSAPAHETVYFAGLGVVWLVAMVDLGFRRGTAGENRYGPDPLAA
jgi:uncharacterized membrane protein YhaH (DUF805 family)